MTLEVFHYYNAPGNINLEDDFKNGVITFVSFSTMFSNSVITWELNKGKLWMCEMYSKFDKEYERADNEELIVDGKKTYHDWLDCEILIPIYIIPNCQKTIGTHYHISIINGYLDGYKIITVYDEPDIDIF